MKNKIYVIIKIITIKIKFLLKEKKKKKKNQGPLVQKLLIK